MPPPGYIPSTSKRGYMNGDGTNARGFNINDFRAHRNSIGILRTHDFHVEIPFPEGLVNTGGIYNDVERNLEFTCDTINFPTTTTVSHKVQRYGYGALETRPVLPQFEDLQCTFMIDQYSQYWRFFHDWLQVAVNYQFDPNLTTTATMAEYEISYKPEYAVDMYLYIYNPIGELVRKVGFREAWPIRVESVPLNWAARDQMIKVPVTFTFFDWRDETDGIASAGQQQIVPRNTGPGLG